MSGSHSHPCITYIRIPIETHKLEHPQAYACALCAVSPVSAVSMPGDVNHSVNLIIACLSAACNAR